MMYKIIWDEKADEQVNKLEMFVSRRIVKKIKELSENPFSKDIKKIRNSDVFRLRIGDYRILFEIEKEIIKILKVGHRKKIYKR